MARNETLLTPKPRNGHVNHDRLFYRATALFTRIGHFNTILRIKDFPHSHEGLQEVTTWQQEQQKEAAEINATAYFMKAPVKVHVNCFECKE